MIFLIVVILLISNTSAVNVNPVELQFSLIINYTTHFRVTWINFPRSWRTPQTKSPPSQKSMTVFSNKIRIYIRNQSSSRKFCTTSLNWWNQHPVNQHYQSWLSKTLTLSKCGQVLSCKTGKSFPSLSLDSRQSKSMNWVHIHYW